MSAGTGRDATPAERTRYVPTAVDAITVPPHPRRPAGPYCARCGHLDGREHWPGCDLSPHYTRTHYMTEEPDA